MTKNDNIPGYFFDKEKNRYFKITDTSIPGFIDRSFVKTALVTEKEKFAEEQRKRLYPEQDITRRRRGIARVNILKTLELRQIKSDARIDPCSAKAFFNTWQFKRTECFGCARLLADPQGNFIYSVGGRMGEIEGHHVVWKPNRLKQYDDQDILRAQRGGVGGGRYTLKPFPFNPGPSVWWYKETANIDGRFVNGPSNDLALLQPISYDKTRISLWRYFDEMGFFKLYSAHFPSPIARRIRFPSPAFTNDPAPNPNRLVCYDDVNFYSFNCENQALYRTGSHRKISDHPYASAICGLYASLPSDPNQKAFIGKRQLLNDDYAVWLHDVSTHSTLSPSSCLIKFDVQSSGTRKSTHLSFLRSTQVRPLLLLVGWSSGLVQQFDLRWPSRPTLSYSQSDRSHLVDLASHIAPEPVVCDLTGSCSLLVLPLVGASHKLGAWDLVTGRYLDYNWTLPSLSRHHSTDPPPSLWYRSSWGGGPPALLALSENYLSFLH